MKNGKAQWILTRRMTRDLLSFRRIRGRNVKHPSEVPLKTKIIWTLIFKVVLVLLLFFIFKAHKQIVSSQDVAQKLLTIEYYGRDRGALRNGCC